MPSPTVSPASDVYATICSAIKNKQSISAVYNGYVREMCPHVLGTSKKGETQCLFYQFAGDSSKGLPPEGEWRCIPIAGLTINKVYGGPWHTGDNHSKPQTCVATVDVEVEF